MPDQPGLLSAPGRELLSRLAGEPADPQRALVLAQALRPAYPPDLIAAALTQQALRAAAAAKFSRAGEMLFTRDGLEQASAELAARHSAARYAGMTLVADLCCGIGGSLTALTAAAGAVLAADQDLTSLRYARHNATVYGTGERVRAVCADVRDLRLHGLGGVFIDPARRAGGRRLVAGRTEPPLDWCLRLAGQVPAVGIKAAPGLDRGQVPAGWETEFLAVGRELKEALIWSPALATAARRATVLAPPRLRAGGTPDWAALAGGMPVAHALTGGAGSPGPVRPGEAGEPVPVAPPGGYLLDPNPAVTRAGLVEELARQLGAWKIDPMIAFLSADSPLRTPFGRGLRVLESAPWQEKAFARRLRELDIGSADIRRRGLAGDVELIRRRLGLRGSRAATIVLTRVRARPWGLICADDAADPAGAGPGPGRTCPAERPD
ncbi:MAG: THUMP-like domain-containing protein [Streptosporangiaceae bacterium]